ncbi:Uma2 family endonuclease [Streptomyces sp. NPDC019990]|uniref:Uma2 family endonuclease n=1 Tax=Streptomyces sp. NPDC019990 TaxID=3154693 RepID=UPI00340C83C1
MISEVVSTSSAREDYDDRTAKYGRYGIPVYLVVDPYVREVVLHCTPSPPPAATAPPTPRAYGTDKLPIPLADGRTFTLDLDALLPDPVPDTLDCFGSPIWCSSPSAPTLARRYAP